MNTGINRQTDLEGELQIGPTSLGLVRIYVSGQQVDLPMDFTPDEAREIAAELLEAAERAAANRTGGKQRQAGPAAARQNKTQPGKPAQSTKNTRKSKTKAQKPDPAANGKRPAPGKRGP